MQNKEHKKVFNEKIKNNITQKEIVYKTRMYDIKIKNIILHKT